MSGFIFLVLLKKYTRCGKKSVDTRKSLVLLIKSERNKQKKEKENERKKYQS